MEFPQDIMKQINEFSKPMTRTDWRLGSRLKRENIDIPTNDLAFEFINWEPNLEDDLVYRNLHLLTYICTTTPHGFKCRWVHYGDPFYGYFDGGDFRYMDL